MTRTIHVLAIAGLLTLGACSVQSNDSAGTAAGADNQAGEVSANTAATAPVETMDQQAAELGLESNAAGGNGAEAGNGGDAAAGNNAM